MRNNFFFTFLLFVCISLSSTGQTTNAISGQLFSNNEPVVYASVFVNNSADSSLVKVTYSDTEGQFQFTELKNGTYFLSATLIGFNNYNSEPFTLKGTSKNMGVLAMTSNDIKLDELVVQTLRPVVEVLPDRTVFNVDKTLNATGSSGLELLRKAPGVVLDNNNNVILEGKTGVQIFIDGKPTFLSGDDLTNFLNSIQSSEIDAIEIITQPSSKYDAAGNAGIINIKLKRDKSLGTNGTISTNYSRGNYDKYNGSLSLNHRNKKTNIYSSYNTGVGDGMQFLEFERLQENINYNSITDTKVYNQWHNTKLGADWFVNPKHTVGVLATGNFRKSGNDGITTTQIIPEETDILSQTLIANNSGTGDVTQWSSNINYRFEDTLGHELSADADYAEFTRGKNSYQPNRYEDGDGNFLFENNYRMNTPTSVNILTGKVDYGQNLWNGKLGLGVKYSLVETDNQFDFYNEINDESVLNNDRSNQFDYSENINAAYINYGRKINDKLSFQVGIRGEQTISKGELTSTQINDDGKVERNYFNLFPSGGLTFKQSPISTWSLNGSRRVQRPGYQSLNPFESQIDELAYSKGNPFLQPQYTSNVKLSNTYKYMFTTSVSYSYVQDFFAQVTDTLGSSKSFLSPRNVADNQVINLGISLPIQIKKWWSTYININAFNSSFKSNGDLKYEGFDLTTLSLYAQNSFLLPKGLKFEISGWFNSPSIWGGTYLTKSMGSLDAAVEKKFMKDKLSLRVAMSDILFTSPWRADLQYGTLKIYGTGGGDSRRLSINLTYNFGNKDVMATRNRKTGIDEEKERAQ